MNLVHLLPLRNGKGDSTLELELFQAWGFWYPTPTAALLSWAWGVCCLLTGWSAFHRVSSVWSDTLEQEGLWVYLI